jgi:hypothetical protein
MIDAMGDRSFVRAEFDQRALIRCELVPPMSTTFFLRRRCGTDLRGDASLTAGQDYELFLRLSTQDLSDDHRPGSNATERQEHDAERRDYERFCAEKIAALERFIDGRPALQAERDAAVAGIYCWAAESVLEIEGPGARFESFVDRAAALSPDDERLRLVHAWVSQAASTA